MKMTILPRSTIKPTAIDPQSTPFKAQTKTHTKAQSKLKSKLKWLPDFLGRSSDQRKDLVFASFKVLLQHF